MNRAEWVYELMELRSGILHLNVKNIPLELSKQDITLQKLDSIIGEITKDDEEDCSSCPAMNKVDNLADAIDQAVLVSKEIKKSSKIGIIIAYEAMKIVQGGTD